MNELSETAKSEITRLHSEILEAARTSVDKAIRIGELLTQEKDKLDHGQWLPWLKANVPFTRATAANYMRCWERREELKCKTVLGEAYRILAPSVPQMKPKPTERPAAQSAQEPVSTDRPIDQ